MNKKKKSYGAIPDTMEGITGSDNIAELWRGHYSTLFNDPTPTHPDVADVAGHDGSHQRVSVTVSDIRAAIALINRSSSPGHDGLTPQHIVSAHPTLPVLFSLLFTSESLIRTRYFI